MSVKCRHARRRQFIRTRTRTGVPLVHHGRHRHTCCMEVGCHFPTVVIGRYDHGPLSGGHPVEMEQAPNCASQNHPEQVVVVEQQRRLERPGRHHQRTSANLEQPRPLHGRQPVVLVQAQDGRIGINRDIRLLIDSFPPYRQLETGRLRGRKTQVPSQRRLLIEKQHPGTLCGRGQSRADPGGSAADHRDIRVQILFVERARGRLQIHFAQAGGVAYEMLVIRPQSPGADKGLVIEPHRQKAGGQLRQGQRIPLQRRPGVLRSHLHSGFHRPPAGPHVRFIADLHQAIRTLPRAAQQAARTVILERTAQHVHTCRRQGRSDGISRMGWVGFAIKREGKGGRTIDHLAFLNGKSVRACRRA